jgi:cytidyltransferase-like protein
VILTSGCFDGLHAGHVAYLKKAFALCTRDEDLVVAVACDDYVRRVKHREAVWSEQHRLNVVSALEVVSEAILHGKTGASDVIRSLRPRFFVKGHDWKGNGLAPDVIDACIDVGCKIVYVNSGVDRHSSDAVSTHQ